MRRSFYAPLKRCTEAVIAAALLALLLPLMLVAACAVLLAMGRPILFKQQRPGMHGKPFTMVKFRTMRNGSASDADRLTRVGQFLRSTSVDELPELWNVVKGDMSLVGPRPLLMEYLPLYDDRQATRHMVRPGITGLAQVNGRNQLDWADRLEADAQYVEQVSPIIDLRILGKTLVQVGQREGISADGAATMHAFTGTADDRS